MEIIPAEELASAVDAYKSLRDMRLEEQRKVDEIKSQETIAKERIIQSMRAAHMSACGGMTHTAGLTEKVEPVIENPQELEDHILATGEFDLLQRRISPTAVRARWDQGQEVPGVGRLPTTNLSLRKNP